MTIAEKRLLEYIGRKIEAIKNELEKTEAALKEFTKLVYMRDLESTGFQPKADEPMAQKIKKNKHEKIIIDMHSLCD